MDEENPTVKVILPLSLALARPAAAAASSSSGRDGSYGGVVRGAAWEEKCKADAAVVGMKNQLYRDIKSGGWHFALNQSQLSASILQIEFNYLISSFKKEEHSTRLRILDVEEEVL